MMNEEMKFLFQSVNKVLEKLDRERNKGNDQAYKTLTNDLREYSKIFKMQSPRVLSNIEILNYKKIEEKLSVEISKIKNVITRALNYDSYKAHHNWIYSYNNLIHERQYINDVLKHHMKKSNDE